MCSKSSRIFFPENKRNVEIENDLHYKQNEVDDGMHDGDLEDGNNEDRKCHLRIRKSTMRYLTTQFWDTRILKFSMVFKF